MSEMPRDRGDLLLMTIELQPSYCSGINAESSSFFHVKTVLVTRKFTLHTNAFGELVAHLCWTKATAYKIESLRKIILHYIYQILCIFMTGGGAYLPCLHVYATAMLQNS